jgi:broad specificity phosphatase PhoE
MKLWFETHSTSIDNERGIASGHLDVPLSGKGRLQAAELGLRYAERLPAIVYTSDLNRAYATAEIAFAASEVPMIQDRRLRECDYGAWSGCSVRQLDPVRATFVDHPFPGGESFRDVVLRVEDFLNSLRRDRDPVLLVAHRAPWYALEHLLRRKDLTELVTSGWNWQPGWEYDL